MDVISASGGDDKIAWYENTDGQGTFGEQQIITTDADGAKSVYATDIDGDGDMDVLSASTDDDKISWYENLLINTDVKQNVPVAFSVYPNPASSEIFISSQYVIPVNGITVYNQIGQRVIHKEGNTNPVDVSMLRKGMYIIEIENDNMKYRSKLIIE